MDSRRLLLQHLSIKGNHVIDTWRLEIEIKIVNPSEVMKLHRAIHEALAHTMDDQGKENARLK